MREDEELWFGLSDWDSIARYLNEPCGPSSGAFDCTTRKRNATRLKKTTKQDAYNKRTSVSDFI